MKKLLAFLCVPLLLLTGSCKDKPPKTVPDPMDQLQVTVQPTYGATDLQLDQTVYTAEGYAIQFTDIRFYLTSLKNGSGKQLASSALFDYRSNGINLFTVNGVPADFPSLTGYFGVDSNLNHEDPTAFPTTDPLNILIANDMHWDWNPGYIFLKIEAKVDTLADAVQNFNHYVVFHVGADNLLQTINYSGLSWVQKSASLYELPLKLDMQKFLQNGTQIIDVKTEHSSHSLAGEEALSLKVIQNLKDALSPM
jgi:hypothetical protein